MNRIYDHLANLLSICTTEEQIEDIFVSHNLNDTSIKICLLKHTMGIEYFLEEALDETLEYEKVLNLFFNSNWRLM